MIKSNKKEILLNFMNSNKRIDHDGVEYYSVNDSEIVKDKIFSKIEDKLFNIVNKYTLYYEITPWYGKNDEKNFLIKFKSKKLLTSYDFNIVFCISDDYFFTKINLLFQDYQNILDFYFKFDGFSEFINFILKLTDIVYS